MFKQKETKNVLILILLHAAIALPLAYLLNIWVDEASTIYSTRHGLVATIQNAFLDEKQAPLYFIILSIWREINDSIFFARLFSVLCSLAAIKVFYDLARGVREEKTAFFITAFFAIHPYLFWASLEIRVYSSVILFSVLLLKLFHDGYLDETENTNGKKTRIYYIITAVVALFTNYYMGFLLVACFAALLVAKRRQAAKTYFVQMLIVGIVSFPIVFILKQQLSGYTNEYLAGKSFAEGLNILGQNAILLVFPVEFPANIEWSVFSIVRICFLCLTFAVIIFFLIKNKFRLDEKVLAFGTIAVVIAAFLLTAYFLIGWQYIAIRHCAVLFAPLFLFSGLIVTEILPRKVLILFAFLWLLLFPYSRIYKQYPDFTKRGDWRRIAEYVEKNEQPNQPIIIFQAYEALALPNYYNGVNKILPNEKFFAFGLEDKFGSKNSLTNQIEFVVSEIPPDAKEIWLMTEEICQTSDECLPLENYVETNYTVIDTKDFYNERVRLLRKK